MRCAPRRYHDENYMDGPEPIGECAICGEPVYWDGYLLTDDGLYHEDCYEEEVHGDTAIL